MGRINIDPGHSETAQGASGPYANEVYLTHLYANTIAYFLQKKGATDYVVLNDGKTSSEDRAIPIAQANASGSDSIFLSVHVNSFTLDQATGSEAWVCTGYNTGRTGEFAAAIYGAYRSVADKYGLKDRGIKENTFEVLRRTMMPAVLIELAFLSTKSDAELLLNDTFRNEACEAIAEELMRQAGQPVIQIQDSNPEALQPTTGNPEGTLSAEEVEKARRILTYFA